MKRCKVCNKELPDTHQGEKCSLCSIGLMPGPSIGASSRPNPRPEGRALTAASCPSCSANLTMADLARMSCAICGTDLPRAVVEQARQQMVPKGSFTYRQDSTRGEKVWPDDAPLW